MEAYSQWDWRAAWLPLKRCISTPLLPKIIAYHPSEEELMSHPHCTSAAGCEAGMVTGITDCNFLVKWQMKNTEMAWVHVWECEGIIKMDVGLWQMWQTCIRKDINLTKKPQNCRKCSLFHWLVLTETFLRWRKTWGFIIKHLEGSHCQNCHVWCITKQKYQSQFSSALVCW